MWADSRMLYGTEIEPMTEKSRWPRVELSFDVVPPLQNRNKGRQKMEDSKDVLRRSQGVNDDNTGSTNAKGKKMIRCLVICKKFG